MITDNTSHVPHVFPAALCRKIMACFSSTGGGLLPREPFQSTEMILASAVLEADLKTSLPCKFISCGELDGTLVYLSILGLVEYPGNVRISGPLGANL